jgi:hypothetical protein
MNIQELRKSAQDKYEERMRKKKEYETQRERDFLIELQSAVNLFKKEITERIWKELEECALKGYLEKKIKFGDFREKVGPVRISTLVKGFHIKNTWDASIFEKLGMTGTPFQNVCEMFHKLGVSVTDVSDITKSTGFWIHIAFFDNE